jgi:hypothetical protein
MPTETMPRIVVVMDEFQVLFNNEQGVQTIETLTKLAKQGRACGVHLIMATQTLKGLDFGTLGSQFSGRIALKCSAEDSKLLLGGGYSSANNEKASEINVPYAIVNTSNGAVAGNIKFAVPKAEESQIAQRIILFRQKSDALNIHVDTKVFEGQKLPERPEDIGICGNRMQLCLGETMDYSSEPLRVELQPAVENNLLICGHGNPFKESLLKSVILSAVASMACEEIVYVGENTLERKFSEREDKITSICSVAEFIQYIAEQKYDKKRIVILDNCDLTKLDGNTSSYFSSSKTGQAGIFDEYIKNANENGSYIVAFYEGQKRIKDYGIPEKEFNYRVGYSVDQNEINSLLGGNYGTKVSLDKNRAFLIDRLEITAWFRPYKD